MAEQTPQAKADAKRRENHFQVRLHQELAEKLRHYMADRSMSANQAITVIISKFFR